MVHAVSGPGTGLDSAIGVLEGWSGVKALAFEAYRGVFGEVG